jgi:hypothetical protein
MPNREQTNIKLVYEQEVESSPYFVTSKALQIYPSEKLFIEIESNTDSITSMKVVREKLNPSKTIEVSLHQEVNETNGNAMFLKIVNPFSQLLKAEVYLQLLKDGRWTKSTILPIQANGSGTEVWYDALLSIGIHNWKLEDSNNEVSRSKMKDEKPLKNISKEATYDWLNRNGIQLNKLLLASKEEIVYTCDSSLYIKHNNADTTTYWTYGWRSHIDTIAVLEWIKNPEYGKTSYLKKVNWDGTLTRVSLMPRTFRTKNDSLFELQEFSHISTDSISNLFKLAYLGEDAYKTDYYENIIEVNSYQKFKLIYHPAIFKNNVYEGNFNDDKITLVDTWECDGKEYFAIEIANYRSNGEETKYTLMFDNQFNCLEYEKCDEVAQECLKNRDFEIHYR